MTLAQAVTKLEREHLTARAEAAEKAVKRTAEDLQTMIEAREMPSGFRMLDTYSEDGIAHEDTRIEALATISAGTRTMVNGKPGLPTATKDGTIYLHDQEGRAPGLAQALAATDYKRLTIAFPWDDPAAFICQHFARHSASALEVWGDEKSLTEIKGSDRIIHQAGTPEYKALLKTCKVQVSVYFHLATWGEDGGRVNPAVLMPDGMGVYRLRFTSRNSLRAIVAAVEYIRMHSGGRIAGIPFEIFLTKREVTDPKSAKRQIWVWQAVMQKPGGLALTSQNFRAVTQLGLSQGQMMKLPDHNAIEDAEYNAALALPQEVDLDMEIVESGGPCDTGHWNRSWHAIAEGTIFEDAGNRHTFIEKATQGRYKSLTLFLTHANEQQASSLIEMLNDAATESLAGEIKELAPAAGYPATATGRANLKAHIEDTFGKGKLSEFTIDELKALRDELATADPAEESN